MTQEAARTSTGPTVMVAIEQQFPTGKRILEDKLAQRILPGSMRAFVWLMQAPWLRDWMVRTTEKSLPGIWSAMMCRKRYIDEKLREAAAEMDAVINLGAGFDTRVYRLSALAGIRMWEIDQPQTVEVKRSRLRKIFGEVPANVQLISVNFDRETVSDVLATYGYGTEMRTFIILEAVTQYLTEYGINSVFEFLAQVAAGSRLVFTYVRHNFIAGRIMYGAEAVYKEYVASNIWRFGMDPHQIDSFLAAHGWRVLEHLGYDELAERYVAPTNRQLASSPVERIVYAEKQHL